MKLLMIIFLFLGMAHAEQGTMNADDDPTSSAPASMSGADASKEIDVREQEVQIDEDGHEPQLEEMDDAEMEKMEDLEGFDYDQDFQY